MQGETEITLANVKEKADEFRTIIDKETGTIAQVQTEAKDLSNSLDALRDDKNVATINAIATLFENDPVALQTLTDVGKRLDNLEQNISKANGRISSIETEMKSLAKKYDAILDSINRILRPEAQRS